MGSTNERPYRELRGRANDPSTSVPDRSRLLPYLGWRDLLQLTVRPSLPPVSRRQAEAQLVDSIRRLTVGEAISLARISPSAAIPALYNHPDKRVLTALLSNPRLVEPTVLSWLRKDDCPPKVRSIIASHPRWNTCAARTNIDTLSTEAESPGTDSSEP